MTVLVVGATGQLGSAVVGKLVERAIPVRAAVRKTSDYRHLERDGVDLAFADLSDASTLDPLCENVDAVIATANTATPREPHDSFRRVDEDGYKSLIDACVRRRVRQFVFASVLTHPDYDHLPLPHAKRVTEQRLQQSGMEYTIFRADAFMDVIFPMMGSELPLRGAQSATITRPFWFSTRFFQKVKHDMASKGEAGILGDGTTRRTYVCIDDMAEFLVRAVGHPRTRNAIVDIGGPEALSQLDVMSIYERVLGKRLTAKHTPAVVFRIGRSVLRLFSPAAANIMGVNYAATRLESVIDMTETAKTFGVTLTSAEAFLRHKQRS
jgi:uncharacterized protein YbjT (DUF2867 family)